MVHAKKVSTEFACQHNQSRHATILGSNTTTPFANTTTLAPVSGLSNATYGIPQAWGAANMPATDFNGNARTWPGAAGAVK